ncbi:hypothetical protein DFH29DRAFT_398442 [Suillus ampliporus]|nr:hypothetical protein DFH29DRAFT_398442 [Suillus ampliporus]
MQTEYSAADIAGARSLQTYAYIYTSMATFWSYDYACSLHQEWTFLLRSRWTKVKGLFIVTRTVPFLLFAGHLYLNFNPNGSPDKCEILDNICSCLSIISGTCSESFFVLRTHALWDNNRFVLAATVTGFLHALASPFILLPPHHLRPAQSRESRVAWTMSTSSSRFFSCFCLKLSLMSLTLIRAIQSWRISNGPLYAVLVKHNVFYYACAIDIMHTQYQYHAMFQDFQFIILAILALRMHLHLWQIERPEVLHGTDALVSSFACIPLTDMSSASRMV